MGTGVSSAHLHSIIKLPCKLRIDILTYLITSRIFIELLTDIPDDTANAKLILISITYRRIIIIASMFTRNSCPSSAV